MVVGKANLKSEQLNMLPPYYTEIQKSQTDSVDADSVKSDDKDLTDADDNDCDTTCSKSEDDKEVKKNWGKKWVLGGFLTGFDRFGSKLNRY